MTPYEYRFMLNAYMTSPTRYGLIIVLVAILSAAYYTIRQNHARTGTEQLSAEEVVDAEVAAQKEYEASGGKY